MPETPFVHLHVHSEYSLLDGSAKITELVKQAKTLGMDSLAITDHGVMFGVIDFYKKAKEHGIKPILGCEVYVASGSRFDKENRKDNFYYHLVLLAENNTGYHNLIKLVSAGFTEGFYYKPRIDTDLLRTHKDGLICLSACLSGPVAKNLLSASYEKALAQALLYDEIFGRGNFYLEMQNHHLDDQRAVNPQLVRMSKETGIPLVCTNDTHYINQADAAAHELLLCIQTGKNIEDENRMRYEGDQFYLKSPAEMAALFPNNKEAITNTVKIAERCHVDIAFNEYKLPKYAIPQGTTAAAYLRQICKEGFLSRYGTVTESLQTRMDYELSVIEAMGFADYFLIVWDFIKYANDNGIIVGPGRGSAAGSIVAYCLRITDIDPIKHNLIFERFLNPERISMPDIDIDFCYERRQEVIDYVIRKYGAEHVAQIITFGTMSAKAVIRDVGRALAMPYADVDRIAKMVPFELGMTIKRALRMSAELEKAYADEADTQRLIDMAQKLEGLPRHASTHAAGVVICDEPVTAHVPLNQNDGVVTTQFPMNTLEDLGLLKMDFLGLRTLTVIQNAVQEIKRGQNIELDWDQLDYADPKTFALIAAAKTEGVFQLESPGMKSFMRELSPGTLEDIIAGIALYRPGPMDFIPKYIRGKRNSANVQYTHPKLEPILKDTYGCIVYQEQVMQIVRDLAGYSLGRSDLVRRAMSKKKIDVMEEERQNFIFGLGDDVPGCIKNGIDKASAEKIFDDMAEFAKYAFNKSHAAAYAVIGYQTAWLKVHYPVAFMAALLTSVMDSATKVAEYIDACKKMGIDLLPPDVNKGYGHFSVSGNAIRFGLNAIKNVGRGAVLSLVSERTENGDFASMTDFVNRLEGRDLNKRALESLIKAGAFDSLGGKRIQYMTVYKNILNSVGQNKKQNVEGQMNLFDVIMADEKDHDKFEASLDFLPEMPEYSTKELLAFEKETLGVYVSGHPLSAYAAFMKKHVNTTSLDLLTDESEEAREGFVRESKFADGQNVVVGGLIAHKSVKYTKKNQAMAFLTLEDLSGTMEVIIFPQIYEKHLSRFAEDQVIAVYGRVSVREDRDASVICNDVVFYDEEADAQSETLWLKIPAGADTALSAITDILAGYSGRCAVIVYDEAKKEKLKLNKRFWVKPDTALLEELEATLGKGHVVII